MTFKSSSSGLEYFDWVYHQKSPTPESSTTPATSSPGLVTLIHKILGLELCTIYSGIGNGYDLLDLPKDKFLGAGFDGMVLIDHRAVESSLTPGPIFLIREGEFSYGGERREMLLKPTEDHFSNESLSIEASLSKDSIRLNYLFGFKDVINGH
jgi:hypothetical protein